MQPPSRTVLVPLFLTFLIYSWSVSAQTPTTVDSDNTDATLNRVKILKEHPNEEQPLELKKLCQHALLNQDARELIALAGIEYGNSLQYILKGLPALPMTVQKQVMAAVLRDDKLWNYDRQRKVTNPDFGEGQYEAQVRVRAMVSKLLGKDIQKASKHYDPDWKKQVRAEISDSESAIIDVTTRERLATELLAQ